MPHRRGHGEDEDRVPASLSRPPRLFAEGQADRLPSALRSSGLALPADGERGPEDGQARFRLLGPALPAEVAPLVPRLAAPIEPRREGPRDRALRRHVQQLLRAGKRTRRSRRARPGRLRRAYCACCRWFAAAVLRPHFPRGGNWRAREGPSATGAAPARALPVARRRWPRPPSLL